MSSNGFGYLEKNVLLNIFSLHGSLFSAVMLIKNYIKAVTPHSVDMVLIIFYLNRLKPACGRQGLDWIVGPEYSTHTEKPTWNHEKP